MRKTYFIKVALLLLPLQIFSQASVSQLTVTANDTATQLAQAIEGSGVTVSNATINCGASGAGTFLYPSTASPNDLGLVKGILLTTGHASDAAHAAEIVSEATGNNFSDPNLTAIFTQAKYDVCILQFDIIPMGDTMSIKYVFGSSEYDGFQCTTYNDVFGFFLTGTNPAGGTYTGQNMATLPGGIAVSINTVNDGADDCTSAINPSFYMDNSSGTDIVYMGLTIPITSVIPVVASSTYHIKIAIADAGDEVYDSGVFIQDGISSNQLGTTTNINLFNKQDNALMVYPNPAHDSFVIEPSPSLTLSQVKGALMQVYDVSGKLVLTQTINGKTTVDATSLKEGVYQLTIQNSDFNITKRLVIVR